MTVFIFIIFVLIIGFLLGNSTCSLCCRFFHHEEDFFPVYLFPVLGIAELICASQILYLFFPAKVIGYIVWILIFILCLFFGRETVKKMINYIKFHKVFLLLIVVVISLYAWPMILNHELMSYQYANNDIMYYLVTDDWMVNHSFFDEITYSAEEPYYALADVLVNDIKTRIGTNILESVIMSMFGLESYQVFTSMGIVYIIGCITGLYYMTRKIFGTSSRGALFLLVPVLIHTSWKEMLILQYTPQIAGVCFLQLFVISLIDKHLNKKMSSIFVSLWLAATISTYAEYSSYLLLFFAGIYGIHIFISKKIKSGMLSAIKIGVFGLIINPMGTFIAIRFNIKTFLAVSDSTESIDAYSGNMKSFVNIISQLFGSVDSDWNNFIYSLTLIVLFAGALVVLVRYILKKRGELGFFVLWIAIVLSVYEGYFRFSGIAYAEYKHLVGISPFFVILILNCAFAIMNKQKVTQFIWSSGVCYIIVLGLINFIREYNYNSICYYNDELMELSEAINEVPEEETVGLWGAAHYLQHEMMYAIKSRNVELMSESYYTDTLGVPIGTSVPNYMIVPVNDDYPYSYKTLWNNGRYKLVTDIKEYKDCDLGTSYKFDELDGFVVEGTVYVEDTFSWMGGEKLCLFPLKINSQSEADAGTAEYVLQLDIDTVFNGSQKLVVYVDGTEIYDETIDSNGALDIPFEADVSEPIHIELYFPEAVSPAELGVSSDERSLSFAVKEFCIYQAQ